MNDLLNDVVVAVLIVVGEKNDSLVYSETSLVHVVGDEGSVGMDIVHAHVDEMVGKM